MRTSLSFKTPSQDSPEKHLQVFLVFICISPFLLSAYTLSIHPPTSAKQGGNAFLERGEATPFPQI